MNTGPDPQLVCTQLGYKSSQCLNWLRISSRRTFRLEQNFLGPIILLGSGIINGLNKSGLCSCMAIIWFVVAMWSGFAYLCVHISLCVCICSVQSENLHNLEIMLRILRILRLRSNHNTCAILRSRNCMHNLNFASTPDNDVCVCTHIYTHAHTHTCTCTHTHIH